MTTDVAISGRKSSAPSRWRRQVRRLGPPIPLIYGIALNSRKSEDAQVARDFRVPIPHGLTDDQAGDLAENLALPVAIKIDHAKGRIGLVHAEVYGDSWDDFIAALEGSLSKSKHRNLLEYARWSRSRWQAQKGGWATSPIKGLRALFVGHTPVEDVLTLANVVYLGTGAVFKGGKLTLAEISSLGPANNGERKEVA